MREVYQKELRGLTDLLVEMTRQVGSAIERSTIALIDADLDTAQTVIGADEKIDALQTDFEERSLSLLALQAPVATDLRMIVTGLRMSSDLERMGDLARHIAKVARMRHPESAIPPELRSTIIDMGQVAVRITAKTGVVIADRDVSLAAELERDDDAMDTLHRQLFQMILTEQWAHGVEQAVDVTLCGRYYERFADHAVSVARRVAFMVTGERYDET